MLIGELSKQTDLSRDTIRFYEKQGLIAVGRKERRFNNYKEYSEHVRDYFRSNELKALVSR
ncbi:MerR family DNA-binding transcriptional regulator [Dyadobacter chenhuakuii]|uniref:MerR family DNA-binding transcriptional regulator n=1 Tax=Dyadobacter chenhuakuii TaxID=2909339 RepID=UPI0035B6A0F8